MLYMYGEGDAGLSDRVESKVFRLINTSSLTTVFSLFFIAAMFPLLLSSTAIFMPSAFLIWLTASFPSSRGPIAQDFLSIIPILSTPLM